MEGHHCTIQEMAATTPKKFYKRVSPFRSEPIAPELVLGDEHLNELFTNVGCIEFFQKLQGHHQ